MTKPLQINPIKLSQPMGAMLFFLGVKNTMPLMHGAQGCASFSKVFFTRHFSDPIAVQTTAVNDITAVIDGGDYSISEAVKNITKKVKPDLVGLFTTGMTETKGDDIKGATYLLKDKQKMVYVHNNPCQPHWNLAERPEDYIWSSAGFYLTEEPAIIPLDNANFLLT